MRLRVIAIIAITFYVISCSKNNETKEYITEWKSLVKKIETKERLNNNQIDSINLNYERLQDKYSQLQKYMSEKDRLRVDSLQMRYNNAYKAQKENDLLNGIEGLIDMVDGISEGFSTTKN